MRFRHTTPDTIVNSFHQLYYQTPEKTWDNTYWLGVPAEKCPLDLWIYQEIIYETKPDLIVETGTRFGGSALFLASICDLVGKGKVVTIDITDEHPQPSHKRITYLKGSSVSSDIINKVGLLVKDELSVMVILDSDHSAKHVLEELQLYSPFVTVGGYLILEDTNINGHPVAADFGPGPMEALDEFLSQGDDFLVDTEKEKFFMTFNPRGFLKRIKPSVTDMNVD